MTKTLQIELDSRMNDVESHSFAMTGHAVSPESALLYEEYLRMMLTSTPNKLETVVGCDSCNVHNNETRPQLADIAVEIDTLGIPVQHTRVELKCSGRRFNPTAPCQLTSFTQPKLKMQIME